MCMTTATSSTASVAALAASEQQLGASTHARMSDLFPDLSEPWFDRLGGSLILIAEELFHVCIRPRLQEQEELGYEGGVPLRTA